MKKHKMTSTELTAAISRQINQATGAIGDEISDTRTNAFERYMGEPYGDEVEDRSSVVSTDVSDTIEWLMPSLMEVFTGGDKIVSFEPEGEEDEELAEQETDTVNYVFNRKNDGFMVLYNFIKDGLIYKNGYVKRHWSEKEKTTTEEYEGVSVVQWNQMQMDWDAKGIEVEILREEIEAGEDDDGSEEAPVPGEPMGEIIAAFTGPSLSVEVRLTQTIECEVVESVPPEEVLISPRWNKVVLDDCPFVAHRRAVMVTDLVEMGYDAEQVNTLPDAFDDETAEEKIERFSTRGSSEYDQREEVDDSTREVLVHECYLLVDWNGDGKAERRRVMVGGTSYEILRWADGGEDNEEVETQPFSSWTPVPIPHRHFGRSIAELVTDLQRIKTVLWRQMLDNIYLTNNATREIAAPGVGDSTLSDLLHDRPGKILRTEAPGMYVEHTPPQFMGQLMPALEYVDMVRENRTGVNRANQGLDANSLNKTATGLNKIMNASMQKIALYARIFAETGLKHLMQGIHGDLRRNATKDMTIKLRNKWVAVDPRDWNDRSDMTVNVGVGTIDKELRLSIIERIIAEQKEHLMAGSPLVTPSELFNSYERFIAAAGLKNPDEFFVNPANAPPAPPEQPKADPASEAFLKAEQMKVEQRHVEAQGKLELEGVKGQQNMEVTTATLQVEMVKAKMIDDRERDKNNMDFVLNLAKINAEGQTTVTVEQIKAATVIASAMNQPPATNGAG